MLKLTPVTVVERRPQDPLLIADVVNTNRTMVIKPEPKKVFFLTEAGL